MKLKFKYLLPAINTAISVWLVFWIAEITKHNECVWWDVPYIITAMLFVIVVVVYSVVKFWISDLIEANSKLFK